MIALLIVGCGREEVAPAPVDPDAALVSLEAPRLLRRMSLDLRGTLPSTDELDAVEAGDEETLAGLRDAYLDDPAFEERLVQLLGERWHTRVDEFLITYTEYAEISGNPNIEYEWERAIGEEPLRLAAHVAAEDRPWSEIVTADTTMATPLMARIWPIEHPGGDDYWAESTYTDGRPGAGVLSTNGLWWRYYSTVSNYNRGRAAALSRLLLCNDYLARPVSLSGQVALVDEEGVESALRSDPYCLGCHSAVDPLASALFGFWVANEYSAVEMETYHAEREQLGRSLLESEPTYFGEPVNGLEHLGELIAADARFEQCTVQTFATLLWRREVESADFGRIDALRADYAAGDGTLGPLLRAITDGAAYRAGALAEAASEEDAARENTTRLMTVTLLSSVLRDLFEFRWTYEGFDQLDNDTYGYRVLGGGVDGSLVTSPQRTPSATWLLTVRRASEAAAVGAVPGLLAEGGGALLPGVDAETRPGDEAFRAALAALHWRLLALRPSEDELDEDEALWSALEAIGGPEQAWSGLVAAKLQDPRFTTY